MQLSVLIATAAAMATIGAAAPVAEPATGAAQATLTWFFSGYAPGHDCSDTNYLYYRAVSSNTTGCVSVDNVGTRFTFFDTLNENSAVQLFASHDCNTNAGIGVYKAQLSQCLNTGGPNILAYKVFASS